MVYLLYYGLLSIFDKIPGAISEGATPVPIPNTEVKPLSADGTYWATSWESRPVPGYISRQTSYVEGRTFYKEFGGIFLVFRRYL